MGKRSEQAKQARRDRRAAVTKLLAGTNRPGRAKRRKQLAAEGTLEELRAAILNPTIIGRGAYNIRKAARGKNAAAKRTALLKRAVDIGGRSVGALSKAASGDYMGALMSGMKILGMGDYTLQRNTIVNDMTASQVPVMHSAKESIRFRHREFLMDVISPSNSSTFSFTTFQVNPGLAKTFPFLNAIALNFQEYKFMGLAFEFKTMSGVAISSSTSLGMGTVSLAAQYRANAPDFQNKVEMMNQMWSVDGRPSDSFMLPIECAPAETPLDCLYIRGAAVPDDIKFYDLCKVTLAMIGIPAASSLIGELWITYDVELYKPQASNVLDIYQPLLWATASGSYSPTQPFPLSFTYNNFDIRTLNTTQTFNAQAMNTNGFVSGAGISRTWTTVPMNSTGTSSFTVNNRSLVLPFGLVGTYQLTLQYIGTAATVNLASGSDAYGNTCFGVSSTDQNNWTLVRQFNGASGAGVTNCLLGIQFNIANPASQTIITLNAGNVFPTGTVSLYMQLIQLNALVA